MNLSPENLYNGLQRGFFKIVFNFYSPEIEFLNRFFCRNFYPAFRHKFLSGYLGSFFLQNAIHEYRLEFSFSWIFPVFILKPE